MALMWLCLIDYNLNYTSHTNISSGQSYARDKSDPSFALIWTKPMLHNGFHIKSLYSSLSRRNHVGCHCDIKFPSGLIEIINLSLFIWYSNWQPAVLYRFVGTQNKYFMYQPNQVASCPCASIYLRRKPVYDGSKILFVGLFYLEGQWLGIYSLLGILKCYEDSVAGG